ncbi:VWA domain-containing protein, partial [bacterium]|nr:VWA domain-containing protein [bacterium]
IKEYEEETNLRSYVLMDISESMRFGSGAMSKLEYGCTIAASLIYLMLQQRDSVGLALFDDRVRQLIPDSSSLGHRQQLLHALAKIEPTEKTELGKVLHDIAGQLRRRGMIIVISDLFGDRERLLAGLRHLRHRRHEVIVFNILDEQELTFPFTDLTLFKGMEGLPQLFAQPQALRDQYLEELNRHLDGIRTECLNSRIDYQRLSTSQPLDVALSSYLATRMALSR